MALVGDGMTISKFSYEFHKRRLFMVITFPYLFLQFETFLTITAWSGIIYAKAYTGEKNIWKNKFCARVLFNVSFYYLGSLILMSNFVSGGANYHTIA